nr:hypothetical protein [Rhizobium sp. G21]
MSLKSVLAAVDIDKDFSDADEKAILAVFRQAYRDSAIGRRMLEDWVGDDGAHIVVNYEKGNFAAGLGTGQIYIDMRELDDAHYLDRHGNAVKDTPFTAIVHELGHALEGYEDNWTIRNPAGDNQNFVNGIYAQAGYTRQLAYMGYDASGEVIEAGVRYADGRRIDNAWVHKWSDLPDDYDTTKGGRITEAYRDLVIGGEEANVLKTGAGDDFLYGLAGADQLLGGKGGRRAGGRSGRRQDLGRRRRRLRQLQAGGQWRDRRSLRRLPKFRRGQGRPLQRDRRPDRLQIRRHPDRRRRPQHSRRP